MSNEQQKFKHISLFSGIGGFDLASEWMGWENIAHCEWNSFCQKILKYYWPNAISYEDITKTDFSIHRGTIDIVTGGFPCQPYSVAGKRKGKDDERHLWPEMLRAIREIQPTWVVGENVGGLLSWNGGLVFNEVQTDLEAEGYEILPLLLPAASVNAPHKRDRIWFIAYSKAFRGSKGFGKETNCNGGGKDSEHITKGNEIRDRNSTTSGTGISSNTTSEGRKEWEQNNGRSDSKKNKTRKNDRFERFSDNGNAPNSDNKRLQRSKNDGGIRKGRQNRSEFITGLLPPNWQKFPTQSPICDGDDGLCERLDNITFPKWRNESIKAGGNAIVPQVALQIFKAIELYEKQIIT